MLKTRLTILLLLVLVGCSQNTPVQFIDQSEAYFGKNSPTKKKVPASFTSPTPGKLSTSTTKFSTVTAKTKDTVYQLSRRYNVPVQDIVVLNKLKPPYQVEAGQNVMIPTAKYHNVTKGETVYSIANRYGVGASELVNINHMKAPYNVVHGQKLRIPSVNYIAAKSSNKIAAAAAKSSDKGYVSLVSGKAMPVKALRPSKPGKSSRAKQSKQDDEALSLRKNFASAETSSRPAYGKTKKFKEFVGNKPSKFIWPIKGKLLASFGPKEGGIYNDGINISAREGSAVKAAADGSVVYVGNELKGYGNLVIIRHGGGWLTAYGHLSQIAVKQGAKIQAGQTIGKVGTSGNVSSPQLHFGIRKGKDAVNPVNHLS